MIKRFLQSLVSTHVTITVNGKKIDPESKEGKETLAQVNGTMKEMDEMFVEMGKMFGRLFK